MLLGARIFRASDEPEPSETLYRAPVVVKRVIIACHIYCTGHCVPELYSDAVQATAGWAMDSFSIFFPQKMASCSFTGAPLGVL